MSSAPAPPNFTDLANQQFAQEQQLVNQQNVANRPNVQNPFGSSTWTKDSFGNWTLSNTQAPALADYTNSALGALGGLSQQAIGALQPLDTSSLTAWGTVPTADDAARQAVSDSIYGQATSRLDPQWQQSEQTKRTQLYNMGLKEGDPLFQQEMDNFQRQKADAYNQANFSAIQGGIGAEQAQFGMQAGAAQLADQQRTQQIGEQLQKSGWSLNQINALLQSIGAQTPNGSVPGATAGSAQAPNLLGAAEAQYQAQLAQAAGNNNLWSNLGAGAALLGGAIAAPFTGGASLAGGAAAAGAIKSDERAKDFDEEMTDEDLDDFLESAKGYSYTYKNPHEEGAAPGHFLGPTAQGLERTRIGRELVHDTPGGKLVDFNRAVPTLMSAVSRLNSQVKELKAFSF